MIVSNKKILFVLVIVLLYLIIAGMQKPNLLTEKDLFITENLLSRYEVNNYKSSVSVVSVKTSENVSIGIDTDPERLNFGAIPIDSISKRFVNITNLRKSDVKVSIEVTGNIKPFVAFDKNDFILNDNELASVIIYFNSTNADVGNYSGNIYIIMEGSKYDFF